MEILRVYQKEQFPIKYYVIKHLIFLKIQIMTNINLEFYIKKFSCGTATRADKSAIKSEIMTDQQSTEELQKPDNEKEEKGNLYSSFKDIF